MPAESNLHEMRCVSKNVHCMWCRGMADVNAARSSSTLPVCKQNKYLIDCEIKCRIESQNICQVKGHFVSNSKTGC